MGVGAPPAKAGCPPLYQRTWPCPGVGAPGTSKGGGGSMAERGERGACSSLPPDTCRLKPRLLRSGCPPQGALPGSWPWPWCTGCGDITGNGPPEAAGDCASAAVAVCIPAGHSASVPPRPALRGETGQPAGRGAVARSRLTWVASSKGDPLDLPPSLIRPPPPPPTSAPAAGPGKEVGGPGSGVDCPSPSCGGLAPGALMRHSRRPAGHTCHTSCIPGHTSDYTCKAVGGVTGARWESAGKCPGTLRHAPCPVPSSSSSSSSSPSSSSTSDERSEWPARRPLIAPVGSVATMQPGLQAGAGARGPGPRANKN
jgi:hypothetical protein